MRQLAVLTFLTLDGVMQGVGSPDEDRSGGFDHGGWATDYWTDVMAQVRREAMAVPYDLLLGRKTYDLFAARWPHADPGDPVATMLNQATKYVVTSATSPLAWENAVPVTGDVVAAITRLKEQSGPLLQVHGSWQLIQTLLANRLIDEFRLWTFPVVVGAGKRLFAPDITATKLNLVRTAPCPNGAVMNIYRPI